LEGFGGMLVRADLCGGKVRTVCGGVLESSGFLVAALLRMTAGAKRGGK